MSIDVRIALEAIRREFLSHLVVDIDGNIRAVEPLKTWPSAEEITSLGKTHLGCAGKFIEQQEMTPEQLQKEIDRLVKAMKLGRAGKLKPGANLVDKSGRIEWAQDAARRRLRREKQQKKDAKTAR